MSIEQHFLGWDAPFLEKVIPWLWERKSTLPESLVIVPTAEAGRKVRLALAENGACLAPQVATAGRFGTMGYQGKENLLLEQILWEKTLTSYDWNTCADFFPKPKAQGWEKNLAEELRALRIQTGEYGLTFHAVSQRLPETHLEIRRWQLLAKWEAQYYRSIKQLGKQDSHEVRNAQYTHRNLPSEIKHVLFIGVTDPTEQAVRMASACAEAGLRVHVLISAPQEVAEGFDALGRPVTAYWEKEKIHWPDGEKRIQAAADEKALIPCLIEALSEGGEEQDVALAVGDKESVPYLRECFKREGINVYDPGGESLLGWSFIEWYRVWIRFSRQEKIQDLRVLIRSPWTARLIPEFKKDFYWISRALEEVSQSAKPVDLSDLWHIKQSDWPFDARTEEERDKRKKHLDDVLDVVQGVRDWRMRFKNNVSPQSLRAFLETVLGGQETEEAVLAESVFIRLEEEGAHLPAGYAEDYDFSTEFLKRLERERLPTPRENVHLEALGWLELAFESASDLIITGLNEGVIPHTEIADTWLPESLRVFLGMRTNRERYAHDVFFLKALLEARKNHGSVRAFFLKTGAQGDPLTPSRLLLQVPRENLAQRVNHCFSGAFYSVPPLAWKRDWTLSAPVPKPVTRLSPSSIKDYLQCPFRYYLKHILQMKKPLETLQEWSNGEFGTLIHAVLENMKDAPEVLEERSSHCIEQWFHAELDQLIEKLFSTSPALAFQIQRESLRQRLSYFAEVEAQDRQENLGWRSIAFEKKFSYFLQGVEIGGVIDRIDQHEDGSLRVVDYKTGKENSAESAHLVKVNKSTNIPSHLADTEVLFSRGDTLHLWTNLQLPIYAHYIHQEYGKLPLLRYGLIGQTKADTFYSDWLFTEEEFTASKRALEVIVEKVKTGLFYPPVTRPRGGYDDYLEFAYGYGFPDAVSQGEYLLHSPPSPPLIQQNLNL